MQNYSDSTSIAFGSTTSVKSFCKSANELPIRPKRLGLDLIKPIKMRNFINTFLRLITVLLIVVLSDRLK